MIAVYGTDSGPPCGACLSTLWSYHVEMVADESGGAWEATPICASCKTERAPVIVRLFDAPTIQEIRTAHQARVDAEREKVNDLIHGRAR